MPVKTEDLLLTPAALSATGVLFNQDMTGYESIAVQVIVAGSATITYESSIDGTTYYTTAGIVPANVGSTSGATTSTTALMLRFPKAGRFFQARISAWSSGAVQVAALVSKVPIAVALSSAQVVNSVFSQGGAVGAQPYVIGIDARTAAPTAVATGQGARAIGTLYGVPVVLPYSIPELTWQYAAAGAIADTTPVAMQAAAGGSLRNYVTAVQLSNTDATVGTIVQILSAATVLWQFYVSPQLAATAGQNGVSIRFPVPLRGAANEAINVKCVTTSAEVYANAQGFVAL